MNKLNVQSIFHSMDGEANAFQGAGQLSTFIRLKGCNLNCAFCDTEYSQDSKPENWMTIDEVIDQIRFPKVTITGGEPLLQKEGIFELCNGLSWIKEIPYLVSIETNGTIIPSFTVWDWVRIVMDYKLPSSGVEREMDLAAFEWLRPFDMIKFVISSWEDYSRAMEVLREHPEWKAQIVFSPSIQIVEKRTKRFLLHTGRFEIENMDWPRQLAEKMIEDQVPAQFSLQIHKVLWPGAVEER